MADTTTTTDYQYVTNTGLIIPDTSDLKTQVEGEYKAVFGQDLVVTNDTPQGVLITAEVAARSNVLGQNAQVANQINPDEAGGVFLDAICALMGLERDPATFGLIPGVAVGGIPNTIIPAGSQATDTAGNLWNTVGNIQLDATGAGIIDFECDVTGPIGVNPGNLNRVVSTVLGWETVNNANAAIPGANEQSDDALRSLRRKTLALQGISTVQAQISALYSLPGVRSLSYRENTADTAQVIDGINLVGHSVWACVYGGEDVDIATSLLNNKTDGAAWNGAVTVAVREPYSGQTYNVLFDRPALVPVLVRVTYRASASSGVADPSIVIPQAVVDYANGVIPNADGFVVGGSVSPFELSWGINSEYPTLFITKVEVTLASNPTGWQTTEMVLALNQVATVTQASVTVLAA